MKISKISISNFRGIKNLPNFEIKDFSILVWDNWVSKTSILEAINFCLSPYFVAGRIKHTDFFNGNDDVIEITIEFSQDFKAFLPDWYTRQEVYCNKIILRIKKRDRAAPNKAFSDIVTIEHFVVPNIPKDNSEGWIIKRKWWSDFKFNERLLSLSIVETEGLPRSFYFSKTRDTQIKKWFNSSISSVFDDFNWRFDKEMRKVEIIPTEERSDNFVKRKDILESEIIEKIDEKSQEKTFDTLNEKLCSIGISEVNLSFIDGKAPFETAFLCQRKNDLSLSINQLWSWIEMIVSLLFLETMAEISKENILILIDEPELHLHPNLQEKLIKHLINASWKNQVLISSHSPLLLKQGLNVNENIQVNILHKQSGEVEIASPLERVLSYISANELNFIAFWLATEEYHNEIYEELKNINGIALNLKDFDSHFFHNQKSESLLYPYNWSATNQVTIHTNLRTQIHHRGTNWIANYDEIKNSIQKMRTFF